MKKYLVYFILSTFVMFFTGCAQVNRKEAASIASEGTVSISQLDLEE